MKKRTLCLCLALLMLLSLAACKGQTDEQDSQPPATPTPTETPTPTSPIPYTDVPTDADYYDAVVWAYKKGITSDGPTFDPDSPCNRGQAITFLWRAMGSPEPQITENPISDVTPSDWFYKPALWAYEKEVTIGDAFRPNDPCTNAEALTLLWRVEGKPMAVVDSSAVASVASGAYYARPAAWADNSGLFAGTEFDPASQCLRADMVSWLYWAETQWTHSEEDKTLQAEYEQIIRNSQLYEVHGSGLCYADYVDMDGKVGLLTLAVDHDEDGSESITATVYMNNGGHAVKAGEVGWGCFGGEHFSLYWMDGRPYFCQSYNEGAQGYDFYKLGSGGVTLEDQVIVSDSEYTSDSNTEALQKYKNRKDICYAGFGIEILDRGLLPSPDEYWAQLFPVKDRAIQAEYEQIINDAQLYEVHGSGLFYADYIDVDNDGKTELLTLGIDWETFATTATVYANMDGHAGKYCEQTFGLAGAENWLGVYQADSQLYLGICRMYRYVGDEYEFFKVENGAFVCNDSVREEYDSDRDITRYIGIDEKDISEDEYIATWKKYTKQKELLYVGPVGFEFGERGILPSSAEYWEENSDPIYAAVKSGDFSYFAGTYADRWGHTLVLDKSGMVTGGTGTDFYTTNQKPIFITVTSGGMIHCVITPKEAYPFEHDGDMYTFYHGEFYDICPFGINYEVSPDTEDAEYSGEEFSLGEIRIMYTTLGGSAGGGTDQYHKIS